ncbi:hypothetical protein SDC9_84033 [bioreactor metagenome]|uniref:Uncharacterized protein n=1 Tax=bioreactor metagenome TaxID=1076179 RepID=A0A644Z959_9ZZZZ
MKKNKSILWIVVLFGLTLSVFFNVKNQYSTLKEAESKNDQLTKKIEILNLEKQKLIKKIEYASSSSFLDQQIHDKLAMGKENDVWLIVPTGIQVDLRPQVNEDKKRPNWQQWLNLFTQ